MAGIGDIQREANNSEYAKQQEVKVSYEQVAAAIEGIRCLLKKGEKITLQDFGTFTIKEKKAGIARNPATGEEVQVPRKFWPHFKFNEKFKAAVNEALNPDLQKKSTAKNGKKGKK